MGRIKEMAKACSQATGLETDDCDVVIRMFVNYVEEGLVTVAQAEDEFAALQLTKGEIVSSSAEIIGKLTTWWFEQEGDPKREMVGFWQQRAAQLSRIALARNVLFAVESVENALGVHEERQAYEMAAPWSGFGFVQLGILPFGAFPVVRIVDAVLKRTENVNLVSQAFKVFSRKADESTKKEDYERMLEDHFGRDAAQMLIICKHVAGMAFSQIDVSQRLLGQLVEFVGGEEAARRLSWTQDIYNMSTRVSNWALPSDVSVA